MMELLLCMKELGRLDALDLVDWMKGGLVVVMEDLGLNGQTVLTTVSRPRKPTVSTTSETGLRRRPTICTNVKSSDLI